jgi:hypothetical protein
MTAWLPVCVLLLMQISLCTGLTHRTFRIDPNACVLLPMQISLRTVADRVDLPY